MTFSFDILPDEIVDHIVLMTDLDTAILLQRTHCISQFLKRKRNQRLLDWAEAAKAGSITRMKYMLDNGIKDTYYAALVHFALINGHVECAQWLWLYRERIKRFLWKTRHQRIHNRFVTDNTLGILVSSGRHSEALWFLDKTNYKFDISAIFSPNGKHSTDLVLANRMLEESTRIVNVDTGPSLHDQVLIKILIRNHLHDNTYNEWMQSNRFHLSRFMSIGKFSWITETNKVMWHVTGELKNAE